MRLRMYQLAPPSPRASSHRHRLSGSPPTRRAMRPPTHRATPRATAVTLSSSLPSRWSPAPSSCSSSAVWSAAGVGAVAHSCASAARSTAPRSRADEQSPSVTSRPSLSIRGCAREPSAVAPLVLGPLSLSPRRRSSSYARSTPRSVRAGHTTSPHLPSIPPTNQPTNRPTNRPSNRSALRRLARSGAPLRSSLALLSSLASRCFRKPLPFRSPLPCRAYTRRPRGRSPPPDSPHPRSHAFLKAPPLADGGRRRRHPRPPPAPGRRAAAAGTSDGSAVRKAVILRWLAAATPN